MHFDQTVTSPTGHRVRVRTSRLYAVVADVTYRYTNGTSKTVGKTILRTNNIELAQRVQRRLSGSNQQTYIYDLRHGVCLDQGSAK